MPDLIRFALGSGLRIGEVCAVRWMDLDLDGIPFVSATDMCVWYRSWPPGRTSTR